MPNKIKELFDGWAKEGQDEAAVEEHSYAAFKVLDSLKWGDGDSYLDIGCGNGYTLRQVAKYAKSGKLLGFDISEKMIEKAVTLSANKNYMRFICADFMSWNFGPDKFDKIFSMEAFYYFSDVQKAVTKTFGLLKKGGVFACVVDFYTENKASEDWPEPCRCGVPMQRHTMAEWKDFFQNAGFKDIEQRQIRYPKELALEEWQVSVGSLLTMGRRV